MKIMASNRSKAKYHALGMNIYLLNQLLTNIAVEKAALKIMNVKNNYFLNVSLGMLEK